jgi:hypothetical protein
MDAGRLPRRFKLALTPTDTTLLDAWTDASSDDVPGEGGLPSIRIVAVE